MKKKKQSNKKVLLFIAFFVTAVLVAFLVKALYIPTKIYHSESLKITIEYPANFQHEETFTDIILSSSKGKIIISRTGTNFKHLDDHINNLAKLNNFTITNEKKFNVYGSPAVDVFIHDKKYYFIYPTAWTIFSLSASSPSLYPDLDRIARAVRYKP